MLTKIKTILVAVGGVLAMLFYALLQRSKRQAAEDARDNIQARADKSKAIGEAQQEAREEATDNEQETREAVRDRRAGLSNDRLHDD